MHQFLSIFHSLESDLLGHRAEQGLNCSQTVDWKNLQLPTELALIRIPQGHNGLGTKGQHIRLSLDMATKFWV